jgi:hypothetical protein
MDKDVADQVMANLVGHLLKAQNVAKMWHWKVRSFSMHLALGELYDQLDDLTDAIMEMYMGRYGTEAHVPMSEPNVWSEQDPVEFIQQLDSFLLDYEVHLPPEGFLINKYQELQGEVSRIRYKMENLA